MFVIGQWSSALFILAEINNAAESLELSDTQLNFMAPTPASPENPLIRK